MPYTIGGQVKPNDPTINPTTPTSPPSAAGTNTGGSYNTYGANNSGLGIGRAPNDQSADAPSYGTLAQAALNQRAPQLDTSKGDADSQNAWQARGSQSNALDLWQQQATGQGPSAADAQFKSGLNSSMLSNLALANSARGGGPAMAAAQANAQMNNAQTAGAANQQYAALRAQEQQAGLQGYSTAAGQIRAGDQSQQGIDYGNAAQNAQFQQQQSQINQQGALGYLNDYQSGANSQTGANASMYGADQARAASEYASDNQFTAQMIGGALGGAGGAVGAFGSDVNMKTNIAPAGGSYGKFGGEYSDLVPYRAGDDSSSGDNDSYSKWMSAIGKGLAGYAKGAGWSSDERGKDAISEGTKGRSTEADRFLSTLKPYSYEYKDPANAPGSDGRYLGVMAQNIERGPTGSTLVTDTPTGKRIEGAPAMSATLAGLGRLHERVSDLEAVSEGTKSNSGRRPMGY